MEIPPQKPTANPLRRLDYMGNHNSPEEATCEVPPQEETSLTLLQKQALYKELRKDPTFRRVNHKGIVGYIALTSVFETPRGLYHIRRGQERFIIVTDPACATPMMEPAKLKKKKGENNANYNPWQQGKSAGRQDIENKEGGEDGERDKGGGEALYKVLNHYLCSEFQASMEPQDP